MRLQILAVLLASAVAACANGPPLVQARAAGPIAPATFRISSPPTASDVAHRPVERQVAAALARKGLRPAGDGQAADYTVEVAYADRSNGVGAAIPQAGGQATTVVAPQRRSLTKPWVRGASTLTVRILESGAGRELYAATATKPRGKVTPDLAAHLVDAALTPLQLTAPIRSRGSMGG